MPGANPFARPRELGAEVFRPRITYALMESVGVAALLFGVSYVIGSGSDAGLLLNLIVSGGVAVAAFVYYGWRAVRRRIKQVEIDDRGFRIRYRGRGSKTCRWAEVSRARHETRGGNEAGNYWVLEGPERQLELSDDGFSVKAWSRLTAALKAELDIEGIAHQTKGGFAQLAEAGDTELLVAAYQRAKQRRELRAGGAEPGTSAD